jgi:hypothetical protein
MEIIIFKVMFWLLLIDSLGANFMAWSNGDKWYHKHFRLMSRYFPMTKGWAVYYLILVLIIGYLVCLLGDIK